MKKIAVLWMLILTMALLAGCGGEKIPYTARSYQARQATAVTLNVRDRAIAVAPSQDENIYIDYFDSEKEFFTIDLTDGHLTMTAAQDKQWKDYIGKNAPREHRIITLRLPQGMLEQLSLSTTNEPITLSPLSAGTVTLSANAGSITFDQLDVAQALDLGVKNGDIRGTLLGGYDDFDITCTTKKGDCNLPERKEGGGKTLSVSANNGDVSIDLTK